MEDKYYNVRSLQNIKLPKAEHLLYLRALYSCAFYVYHFLLRL